MSVENLITFSADSSVVFARLAAPVQADIRHKLRMLEPILALKRGAIAELHKLADRIGVGRTTTVRWYYAAREGDYLRLANKWHDPKLWKIQRVPLPQADIALFHAYALSNQRRLAPAIRQMHRDWRAGKITSTQPFDPKTGLPEGWSPRNLRQYSPSNYELVASRVGRAAASLHRPKVITTRVGLRVGQYYVGDDVWHDNLVDFPGQRIPVRPLEADVLDLYSASLVKWGLRPRRKREDGSRENLTEREVRWVIAATLRDCGYRTDERGTTWLVEHGTFAIREELARTLWDFFRIRVETSAILSDVPWLGSFGGKGGGNPRFKAALESFHNLRHNELAALPGQVGKDRDSTPEEHRALLRYAEAINDAAVRLAQVAPDYAARLLKPVMLFTDFAELNDKRVAIINDRIDHALEGWAECGHKVVQYLVGEQLLDESKFLALPTPLGSDIIAWGRALAEQGQTKTRLMSPSEVYRAGRSELSKLPAHGVSLILGPELAREEKVTDGEFVWRDGDLGLFGEWRYFAEITIPNGYRQLLRDGETYLVHPNPFAYDELCVADAKGRHLGVAHRHDRPCRADVQAMQEQFKQVKAHEAALQRELQAKAMPITRERINLREQNATVLDEALYGTPAERKAVAKLDQADEIAADLARRQAKATGPVDADWMA